MSSCKESCTADKDSKGCLAGHEYEPRQDAGRDERSQRLANKGERESIQDYYKWFLKLAGTVEYSVDPPSLQSVLQLNSETYYLVRVGEKVQSQSTISEEKDRKLMCLHSLLPHSLIKDPCHFSF